MSLAEDLKKVVKGEAVSDQATLEKYSRDASLFKVRPQAVVFPKDTEDVKALVNFVNKAGNLSLTARSGGTDMTGGPLNESIIVDFSSHFNKVGEVTGDEIKSQPGVWYRDFEKKTLERGMLLPSYPASREICAIGGMVNNNSGGEKTLKYGKTENYVHSLKAVLRDGQEYEFKKLTKPELDKKMRQKDFEGEIYRGVFKLLDKNYDLIKKSKPKVSKNSTGYNLWPVWDKEKGEFDLSKIFVGAQGTLGITTETTFRLVKAKPHSGLLVIFMKSLKGLPEVTHALLPLKPVSFESFDDHTFKLAVKFFWGFARQLGWKNFISLAWRFLPEVWLAITGGIPKLVLLVEFEGDNQVEVDAQIQDARFRLSKSVDLKIKTLMANTQEKARKYWLMRRESFNLLRHRVKGKKTAPFIDDLIVPPEHLVEFLPKLYEILDRYQLLYTIAGHVGDGNFHIIPLMRLADESERAKILPIMEEVTKLILSYQGSLSAEHNDGLIRGPYLRQMYGDQMYEIFKEIKVIFDPLGIFNPHKKTAADLQYSLNHIVDN